MIQLSGDRNVIIFQKPKSPPHTKKCGFFVQKPWIILKLLRHNRWDVHEKLKTKQIFTKFAKSWFHSCLCVNYFFQPLTPLVAGNLNNCFEIVKSPFLQRNFIKLFCRGYFKFLKYPKKKYLKIRLRANKKKQKGF